MLLRIAVALMLAAVSACAVVPVAPGQYAGSGSAAEVSDKTRARFERAVRAQDSGDLEAAEAAWLGLVEDHPELSGPRLNLALLHWRRTDLVAAEREFRAALVSNPRNIDACNQYGIFLREQGRFDEAETMYLQALEVSEDRPDTHRNIAVLYDLYKGDRERALQHFYRYQALSAEPDRQVAGWIADLERQLTLLARGD